MKATNVERLRVPPKREVAVLIGCRWSPEHLIFRDRANGIYAERNSMLNTDSEMLVQSVLLSKPKQAPWWKRFFDRRSTARK